MYVSMKLLLNIKLNKDNRLGSQELKQPQAWPAYRKDQKVGVLANRGINKSKQITGVTMRSGVT